MRARHEPAAAIRHLYVHVPFCAHRCGYCDFVTVTGHEDERARYVDALIAEMDRAARRARDGLRRWRHSVHPGRRRPGPPARRPPCGDRDHGRVQPRDDHAGQGSSAGRGWRDACVARRPELPPAPAGRARAAGPSGADRGCRRRAARGGRPKPQPRPDLWGSGPGPVRPSSRPRRPAGARAGPRELLRARGQARHALHAPVRPRAGAAGRRDGGLLRACRRDAPQRRLSLVRDRQLLPAGPRVPAQPRLLARARLPRPGGRRRLDDRPRAAPEPARACAATSRLSRPGANRRPRSSC